MPLDLIGYKSYEVFHFYNKLIPLQKIIIRIEISNF
jgi:hypothetical protein